MRFFDSKKAVASVLLLIMICFACTACNSGEAEQTNKNTASSDTVKSTDKEIQDKVSTDAMTQQDVAQAFMKAMYVDFDAQAVVDLIHKDDVKFMCNYTANTEQGAMTNEEFVEFVQSLIDGIRDTLDKQHGEWTISYMCTDERDSKDFEVTELELIQAHYKEAKIEIEETKAVLMQGGIEFEENGQPSVDDSVLVSVYVVKVDGKWYLDFDETLYIG